MKTKMCDCGEDIATVPAPNNDLLCVSCAKMLRDHGWCMAIAARNRKLYGENWTVAQASCYRESPNRVKRNEWKPGGAK